MNDSEFKRKVQNELKVIKEEIQDLASLSSVFDRWHENMYELVENNNKLKEKNDKLNGISKTLLISALNARIVAVKAGSTGNSFHIVSKHISELATDSRDISKSYLEEIDNNETLTIATFQDVQAISRLILTKLAELEIKTDALVNDIQQS
jgi:methyl-accepting chemotaxis protein